MIDFRYHLVSLISVFLALAVGIVLGAGPLRDTLGDQLSGQVEQLRTEQDTLRGQVDELEASNDQLASFISGVGPQIVSGALAGQDVAVITDDDSTRGSVSALGTLLEDAGAGTTSPVALGATLWDPAEGDARDEAVADVEEIAPGALISQGADDATAPTSSERLATLVVTLLSADDPAGLTDTQREQLWKVLQDHQLVTLADGVPGTVDAVVYASADPAEFTVEADDETTATERAQGQLAAQSALLARLVEDGVPAVVAAVTPANDASTGILRTVRGDSRFTTLSTTDRLQEADGPVLAVLALVEQTRGGSGAYGTTTDADARLPQLPETQGLGTGAGASDGGGEG